MEIEIYSKDNCAQCLTAKSLIKQKCINYVERTLGKDISVQELMEKVEQTGSTKPVRMAPQIFLNDENGAHHIGSLNDLQEFLRTINSSCEKAA